LTGFLIICLIALFAHRSSLFNILDATHPSPTNQKKKR